MLLSNFVFYTSFFQFSKMQTRPLFLLLSYVHSLKANKLVEPALTQASCINSILSSAAPALHHSFLSFMPCSSTAPSHLLIFLFHRFSLPALLWSFHIIALSLFLFFCFFKSPAPQILTAPLGLI